MIVSEQFVQLLVMVLSGIAVGFIIDSVRLIVFSTPKRSSLRRWMMVFELLTWILLGGLTYYLLFWLKDGAWRAYDPLAQIAGIFLYQTFFQTFLRFIAKVLVNIIWRPFWFVVQLIIAIIRQILQILMNIGAFILRPFVKIYSYLSYTFFKKVRFIKYNKRQQ
ncbi:spore cortex biosynthesis protein YabQ [Lysinibacillus sp. RS5]|jgi:spore cortex biosynthesis protein YabQ|uniref:spore cortex biosynthesis protein YabQ n=1 Tax=unclassified Lysinibacillus TaxID=2636778 RepID=UPI0035BE578B